jgi:DNA-binding response OmpR family regulator
MSKKPHLFYLEDDPDYIQSIVEELEDTYQVTVASSLVEARSAFMQKDFKIALIDVSMNNTATDSSGLRFIEEMRQKELFQGFPFVVITGFPGQNDRVIEAFRDLGVADFLLKGKIDTTETIKRSLRKAWTAYWREIEHKEARVLVIEDDLDWQSDIAELVEEEGCQVDAAASYSEAIDLLASNTYQLALVDIRLGETSADAEAGFNWVEMNRRLNYQTPVIFISGEGDSDRIYKAAFEYGAKDFINKGNFRPLHLRRRIRDILRRIFYVQAVLHTDDEVPLVAGRPYRLDIRTGAERPDSGLVRSLARPVVSGRFDMEVTLQPFDIDVFPGTSQVLTVENDSTSGTLSFDIVPVHQGTIEIVVDFVYQGNMLNRLVITRDTIDPDSGQES